jgi:hypothetical protein
MHFTMDLRTNHLCIWTQSRWRLAVVEWSIVHLWLSLVFEQYGWQNGKWSHAVSICPMGDSETTPRQKWIWMILRPPIHMQFRLPIGLNSWRLKGRTDVCGVAVRPIAWTVGLSEIRQFCLQALPRDSRNVRVTKPAGQSISCCCWLVFILHCFALCVISEYFTTWYFETTVIL